MIRKPISYGHQSIDESDIEAVMATLRSDYLTQGPKIKDFEEKFANYIGARYAVAVNNATSGLHLATTALGVAPGDNVIVTPLTFAATANCVRYCGGNVTFCDINPKTYLMDISKLRTMLQSHPAGYFKGVIIVDFAGYPHNLEEYRNICNEYGLWLIEDACHAPGAWFTDSCGIRQKCGNGKFADCSIFSFHPVKHITTGEGGMVTTDNPEIYRKLRLLHTHGITKDPELLHKCDGGWYYEMQELGFNCRLTDFQAALGISQLSKADEGLTRRQEIAKRYDDAFRNIQRIMTPYRADDIFHAFHLYVIKVDDRKGLYEWLHDNGIFAQVHYIPLHLMPYYQRLGSKKGDCPVAEDYYEHCLSLPMYPSLSDEEQEYVIEKVLKYIEKQ